jgi:hypothetical protein
VSVLFHVLAPAEILGQKLAMAASAGGSPLPPSPAMVVGRVGPPSAARPVLCGIEQDETDGRWRVLRGWVLAQDPVTAVRYSPDGRHWFDAPASPDPSDDPASHPAYPFPRSAFCLEIPVSPDAPAGQDRLLCLAGDCAVDLLTGWPLAAGRHYPRPLAFGINSALQEVLSGLHERLPGLRAVMTTEPHLLVDLAILPHDAGVARLFLAGDATPPADTKGAERVEIGFDVAGLAAAVPPMPDPLLEAGPPVLLLDGTGASPALLQDAVARAQPVAEAAGLRLAVVVDAPPLEGIVQLRRRLGLPPEVLPVWPQSLAAASPREVRAMVDLGALPGPGPVAAIALSRSIPLGLCDELAPTGMARPWPRLSLLRISHLPAGAAAWPSAPYAQLDDALSRAGAAATRA